MSESKQRPKVRDVPMQAVEPHAKVIADITGMPEWKARNIVKWRMLRELSVNVGRVLEFEEE